MRPTNPAASSDSSGYISCRSKVGPGWSAPGTVRIEGGSVGFQIGATEEDVVLLVMNEKGAKSVMSSKVKLGGDASVAAGPVGRATSAETDIAMNAEILSWSRNKGVFAGISLEGSTLRSDGDANKHLYGRELDAKQIVLHGAAKTPPSGAGLIGLLNRVSPRHV